MLDVNKHFPLQISENRPNECVGEAIADVLGNYSQMLLDPDFSEAAGFHLLGEGGSNGGIDVKAAMYAACVFGALPNIDDYSDPIKTSEAKETDWGSYTQLQIELAAKFAPAGIVSLDSFDQVTAYLARGQMGCVLHFQWYPSFEAAPADAQLPIPGATEAFSQHAVACYGVSAQGLQLKCWDIGAYRYMPRSVFEKAFVEGFAFDMTASRWWTYVNAILYSGNWSLVPLLNSVIIKKP